MTPSPLDPSNHGDWRFRYSVRKREGYVMGKSSTSPIRKRHLVCQTIMIISHVRGRDYVITFDPSHQCLRMNIVGGWEKKTIGWFKKLIMPIKLSLNVWLVNECLVRVIENEDANLRFYVSWHMDSMCMTLN